MIDKKTIGEVSIGLNPIFDHQMSATRSLIIMSGYFTELGIKLRKTASNEQADKYNELVLAYKNIRSSLGQNFIHEFELSKIEQAFNKLVDENRKLKALIKNYETF